MVMRGLEPKVNYFMLNVFLSCFYLTWSQIGDRSASCRRQSAFVIATKLTQTRHVYFGAH